MKNNGLPHGPKYRALARPLVAGFNPRRIADWARIPRYMRESREFRRKGGTVDIWSPVLQDYEESAGTARGHYFHQDLLVASKIFRNDPKSHVDVGSRIDGFVAHVAAFRKIQIIDIRALDEVGHPNIEFLQKDLLQDDCTLNDLADSVSCLHALEHFGLGRYGDPIDPNGHRKGLKSLTKMVSPGGRLYLGLPIAGVNQVHFNAQRIFSVQEILSWSEISDCFNLEGFDFVDDAGDLIRNADPSAVPMRLKFGCGIFEFKRFD